MSDLVERLRMFVRGGRAQCLNMDFADEAAAEIEQLRSELIDRDAEHSKQIADMAERFRAVNIARVIEQTGANILKLRDRAEAAEAQVAKLRKEIAALRGEAAQ